MVEVVVPFRGGCPHRERAWAWCRERYPWSVTEAPGPDPWNKALAVMPAIERSSAEIIVVADADVWCDALPAAVQAVRDGAPWAIPHRGVFRLTEASTAAVFRGEPWEGQATDQRAYLGAEGGGYVIARREMLLDIPLDPRFVGWGQEDHSLGVALQVLAGHRWRGKSSLVHLWHPPQERLTRRKGSAANWALYRRYVAARGPQAMRDIIEEAKCH